MPNLTEEEVRIMKITFDNSNPNRVCTSFELEIAREQVRISRKLTEGEFLQLQRSK